MRNVSSLVTVKKIWKILKKSEAVRTQNYHLKKLNTFISINNLKEKCLDAVWRVYSLGKWGVAQWLDFIIQSR